MNKSWLSVLMPTYNGEKYLSQALHSVFIQGRDDIECIIVDDGSCDSTLSIIDSYLDKLPIKLIQQPHTGNWAANTDIALSAAQSDYICFLHQDDLWLEGRLGAIKRLIEQCGEANLFLHPSWFINESGNRLGLWQCPLPSFPALIDADAMIERLLVQNFISIPAPVFKRKIALDVGGLDANLWYAPDWDLWLKIASYGKIIYYPQVYSAFRLHSASQTVIQSFDIRDFAKELETVLERHLHPWKASSRRKAEVKQTALFSVQVNISLAGLLHGKDVNLFKLAYAFMIIGSRGWVRYLRDSRITQRLSARVRARLKVKPEKIFKIINSTAERSNPSDITTNPIYQQHLSAYYFVKPLVSGKTVLDIGCGQGYGTALLAESASKVIGVDYSRQAVAMAKERYASGSVEFLCLDALRLDFRDARFEAVVAFQLIEHLKKPELLLAQISRLLAPAGLFILTTPNRAASIIEHPYHFKEYTREELELLLKKYFSKVEILGLQLSASARAFREKRRQASQKFLRFDILRLHRILPRFVRKATFDLVAAILSRKIYTHDKALTEGISISDYAVCREDIESAVDLVGVCQK